MQNTSPFRRHAIPLYDRSGAVVAHTLVSPQDYARLVQHRWHNNGGYAKRGSLGMHREILGLAPGDGLCSDHINGDTLDNRRENLRVVTHAQNMQNRKPHKNARHSRFNGVYLDQGRWRARVRMEKKTYHLGYFKTEVEAAAAVWRFQRERMPLARPCPAYAEVLAQMEQAA